MKLRVISAVEYDATQMRLMKAKWRTIDTSKTAVNAGTRPEETPEEVVDINEVVSAIKAGEKVTTIFFVESNTLKGPLVELAMYGHGNESIVIPNPDIYQDKRIRNLPRLNSH